MSRHRRWAAVAALVLAAATVLLAAAVTLADFPRGLVLLAALPAGVFVACHGLLRRGALRALLVAIGLALVVVGAVLLITRQPVLVALAVAAPLGAVAAAA